MNYAEAFNSKDTLGIEDIGDQFEQASRNAKLAFNDIYDVPFSEMEEGDVNWAFADTDIQ